MKESDIKEILPRIERTQDRFDAYSGDLNMENVEVNEIIYKLEDKLRPYDKIVSDFVVDKLIFDIKDNDIVAEIIKLGDVIMGRYGTEPKQVMLAFEDALDLLSMYVEPDGPVDEGFKDDFGNSLIGSSDF
jgi:hypothetical protein